MAKCDALVFVTTTSKGADVVYACGEFYGGNKVLCAACEAAANRRYPQGWDAYPGDVCSHGVYVGGCGVDWMCGACEAGE